MKYDKLVKALRDTDFSDGCPCMSACYCEDTDCVIVQAADAIEELQSVIEHYAEVCVTEIPRWIPVTERLPEPWEPVLVTYIGYNSHLQKADMLAYIDSDDGL